MNSRLTNGDPRRNDRGLSSSSPPVQDQRDQIAHIHRSAAVEVGRAWGGRRRAGASGENHSDQIGHVHHAVAVDIADLLLREDQVLANAVSTNHRKDSVLQIAISNRRPAIMRLLVERGADPLLQDYRGETAWQIAERYHHWEGDFAPTDPAEVERHRAAHQEILRLLQQHKDANPS